MPAQQTRTVTFLYTDVESSTRGWEEQPAAMRVAVDRHFTLLRDAVDSHGGHVFRTQGDGLCAAFATAAPALAAALAAQLALQSEPWPAGPTLRVRMALHSGAASAQDGDYVGACLNRMGRLLAIGHGGQTLLSRTTTDLVREIVPAGAALRDLGEHRLRDLAAPEQIFQLLHPDLPDAFPALASLDALPNNLPLQLSSFVGREREVHEVKRLLSGSRLVTLTGSGGCGKTRLALQVGADLLESYPGGVWFVDLAPLSDDALVHQAILAALDLRETAGRPPMERLIEHLRPRSLLLILDNCEHLVESCARAADTLLRACPGLRLVATSRETLGVTGETTWRVPSLSLPDPTQAVDAASLSGYEAAALFVERARLVEPAFALTEGNAAALAKVCRRLDGMPLAIELAAARVRVLTVEQIAARLDDRFRLLTGGSRTALRRQQTLQALIDWSYALLPEAERTMLCRLAAFAGGWTLEAAEAICPCSSIARRDVLDLLGHLVDKSLVVAERQGGEERYRLLETIRQYAVEKLAEAGDAAVVREAHARHFLAFAEQASARLEGPDQRAWLDRMEAEHDNLRAALEWSESAPDGAEAEARLVVALAPFWECHGYLSDEALAFLERALDRMRATAWSAAPPDWQGETTARVYEGIGLVLRLRGPSDEVQAAYRAGLEWAPRGSVVLRARLYRRIAQDFSFRFRTEEAGEAFDLAEAALGPEPDVPTASWWQQWAWIQIGRVHMHFMLGRVTEMTALLRGPISDVVNRFGTPAQRVELLYRSTLMNWRADRWVITDETLGFAQAAFTASIELGDVRQISGCQYALGICHLCRWELDAAEAAMQAVRLQADRTGEAGQMARSATALSVIYRAQGRIDLVPEQARRAIELTAAGGHPEYAGAAIGNQAWVAWREGDLPGARRLGERAFESWREIPATNNVVDAYRWTACWPLIAVGLAEDRLGDAVDYARELCAPDRRRLPDELEALLSTAIRAFDTDDGRAAREELEQAVLLAEQLKYL